MTDRRILSTTQRAKFLDDGRTCCICIPERGRRVLVTMLRVKCDDDSGAEKIKVCYCQECFKAEVAETTDTLTLDGYEGATDRHFVVRYPDGKKQVLKAESVDPETGAITFDGDIEAGDGIRIYPLGFTEGYDTLSLSEGINTISSDAGIIAGYDDDMPVEILIDDLVQDSESAIEAALFVSV